MGAEAREPDRTALMSVTGAAVGALGVFDVLLSVAAFAEAGTLDASPDGAAAAAALRMYALRVGALGVFDLLFVWVAFAEAGARPAWLLLPLASALADAGGDALALLSGGASSGFLTIAAAAHTLLASSVAAVALSAMRADRAPRGLGSGPVP